MMLMCGYICVFIIIVILPFQFSLYIRSRHFGKRSDLRDLYITKIPILVTSSYSVVECATECEEDGGCYLFSFRNSTTTCVLFSEEQIQQISTEVGLSWVHYSAKNPNTSFDCNSDGYILEGSSGLCLKVYAVNKTYNDANATCQSEKARMVVLEDATTFIPVNDYVRNNYPGMVGYLLGLTDRFVEDSWVWENGNPYGGYPVWNGDQPNGNDRRQNGAGADCAFVSVVYHTTHKKPDKIYDDYCEIAANFICQRVGF